MCRRASNNGKRRDHILSKNADKLCWWHNRRIDARSMQREDLTGQTNRCCTGPVRGCGWPAWQASYLNYCIPPIYKGMSLNCGGPVSGRARLLRRCYPDSRHGTTVVGRGRGHWLVTRPTAISAPAAGLLICRPLQLFRFVMAGVCIIASGLSGVRGPRAVACQSASATVTLSKWIDGVRRSTHVW